MNKRLEKERKGDTAGCPDTVSGVGGLGKIFADTIRMDPKVSISDHAGGADLGLAKTRPRVS